MHSSSRRSAAPPFAATFIDKGSQARATIQPVQPKDLQDFARYLRGLKKFAETVLKDCDFSYFTNALRHYKALQVASTQGIWTNPLENVDKRLLQHSLCLMKELLVLKNNIVLKKDDPILYPAVAELWCKSLQLAQEVLENSRNEWGFSQRERKIEVLLEALKKTAELVKNPENAKTSVALMATAMKMRAELEGPFLFRRENRLWAGVVGLLGFLVGFAVYMLGILAVPETMIGGILGMGVGIALMLYTGRMIYRAIWPDDHDVDGIKNEKAHARDSALSFYSLGKMVKSAPTLFAPKPAALDPKSRQPSGRRSKSCSN